MAPAARRDGAGWGRAPSSPTCWAQWGGCSADLIPRVDLLQWMLRHSRISDPSRCFGSPIRITDPSHRSESLIRLALVRRTAGPLTRLRIGVNRPLRVIDPGLPDIDSLITVIKISEIISNLLLFIQRLETLDLI